MVRKPVTVSLEALQEIDKTDFICANQVAFNYGALEEFGPRHTFFEEEGQVIARATIEEALAHGQGYWVIHDGQRVGGLILLIEGSHGDLDTLFISPEVHSKGLGYAAWCAVERAFPEVQTWEAMTPYYDQRNIHFYVNRCGFHIVEYYNQYHQGPEHDQGEGPDLLEQFPQGFFRFEKRLAP